MCVYNRALYTQYIYIYITYWYILYHCILHTCICMPHGYMLMLHMCIVTMDGEIMWNRLHMIQIDSSSSLTSLNRWLSTGVLRVFRVFLFLCKRRTETDTCFSWHAHAPYSGLSATASFASKNRWKLLYIYICIYNIYIYRLGFVKMPREEWNKWARTACLRTSREAASQFCDGPVNGSSRCHSTRSFKEGRDFLRAQPMSQDVTSNFM